MRKSEGTSNCTDSRTSLDHDTANDLGLATILLPERNLRAAMISHDASIALKTPGALTTSFILAGI